MLNDDQRTSTNCPKMKDNQTGGKILSSKILGQERDDHGLDKVNERNRAGIHVLSHDCH